MALKYVIRKRMRALGLMLLLGAATGCAMMKPKSAAAKHEDYQVTELAADTFGIQYTGHGKHAPGYVEDLMMLEAADLTLDHGYKYFALIGVGGAAKPAAAEGTQAPSGKSGAPAYGFYGPGLSAFGTPAMTQTAAPASQTEKPAVGSRKPGLVVKCFNEEPVDLIASDAANIEKSIRKKYNLDEPPRTAGL